MKRDGLSDLVIPLKKYILNYIQWLNAKNTIAKPTFILQCNEVSVNKIKNCYFFLIN